MPTSIAYLQEALSNKNVQAALMAIRKCEGTSSQDGYRFLFGSKPTNAIRFTGFAAHPNIKKDYVDKAGAKIITTAAGAYQIIKKTYELLCMKYGFSDFSPTTQDLMAVSLLDSENVLKQVMAGNFFKPEVLDKLNNQWASLPMAGYNQPEKSIATVKKYYLDAGGVIV